MADGFLCVPGTAGILVGLLLLRLIREPVKGRVCCKADGDVAADLKERDERSGNPTSLRPTGTATRMVLGQHPAAPNS